MATRDEKLYEIRGRAFRGESSSDLRDEIHAAVDCVSDCLVLEGKLTNANDGQQ